MLFHQQISMEVLQLAISGDSFDLQVISPVMFQKASSDRGAEVKQILLLNSFY